jgi:hypothetical protein
MTANADCEVGRQFVHHAGRISLIDGAAFISVVHEGVNNVNTHRSEGIAFLSHSRTCANGMAFRLVQHCIRLRFANTV